MENHILDRPVWSALTTVHAPLALGGSRARSFQADISPFAAAIDESAESLADLAALLPSGGYIYVAQAEPIVLPEGTRAGLTGKVVQMFLQDDDLPEVKTRSIERLGEKDAPEMVALAALTKPGPFLTRTHILGEFWGVKEGGRLIAMTGERFKQPGFTEVSGVCTHPDFLGRGLAHDLCVTVAARIRDRGEQAYLHVFTTNTRAIRVYEHLGFRIRKELHVAQVMRA